MYVSVNVSPNGFVMFNESPSRRGQRPQLDDTGSGDRRRGLLRRVNVAECCANTRSAGKKKGRGNPPFARGEDGELRGERGEGIPSSHPLPHRNSERAKRSIGEVKRARTTTTRSSLWNSLSLSRWNLTTSRRRRACQQPTLRELPRILGTPWHGRSSPMADLAVRRTTFPSGSFPGMARRGGSAKPA